MRTHAFIPDDFDRSECWLCGQPADSPQHRDALPDFERADDEHGDEFPPNVTSLFESYGIKLL